MSDERAAMKSHPVGSCWHWLVLLRTFGLAISVQFLLLATVGALLTSASWWITGRIFYGNLASEASATAATPTELAFTNARTSLESWPGKTSGPDLHPNSTSSLDFAWDVIQGRQTEPFVAGWNSLSEPFRQLFSMSLDLRMFSYFLCGGLLSLVIWSVFGGAIVRSAAVQLGREQRIGLTESVAFSIGKLGSFIAAPLFSLFGIAGIAALVALLGLLMWAFDFGVLIAGLLWIFVLIGSFLMTILAIGLLFGWPLMWGTIGSEGTDAFDALSRSYAYTFQRPLHYLFYVLVAGVIGALGWLLVGIFAELVIYMGLWAASWGAGADRLREIAILPIGVENHASGVAKTGVWLIGFWNGGVRAIAHSFSYSFFWTVAAGIYLLLRREVDQTEMDEVHLEDEADIQSLPKLAIDEAGVPGVPDGEKPAEEDA